MRKDYLKYLGICILILALLVLLGYSSRKKTTIRPEIMQESIAISAAVEKSIIEGTKIDPVIKERAFNLLFVNTFQDLTPTEIELLSAVSFIFQSYWDYENAGISNEGLKNVSGVFQENYSIVKRLSASSRKK